MPIRVLLSDDEALARERLRGMLEGEPDLEVVAECGDGKSAISLIKREKPDLVFLDIQMPEIDGFGVVSALRDGPMPMTIFVTAYDRYAMKAFEVHALDYLLKPVVKERLTEALDHARKQLQHPSEAMFQRRVLDMLGDLDSRQSAPQRIVIKADGEIVCLKPGEIDWAESAGNYVCLHVGGNTHILRETITSLETRLGHRQFLRVHRSTLVNVDRIKTLRPSLYGDYAILLRDGTKLTLAGASARMCSSDWGQPRKGAVCSSQNGMALSSRLRFLRRVVAVGARLLGCRALSYGLLQFQRNGVHQAGLVHQHLSHNDGALIGVCPFALFDSLAYGGNGLHRITGIGAGSIDLVFEPRPLFQSLSGGKRALQEQESGVDGLQIRRLPGHSAILIQFRNCLMIALRGLAVGLRLHSPAERSSDTAGPPALPEEQIAYRDRRSP